MMNNNSLFQKLERFGFELKEIDIYLNLLQKGVQTPLEISRNTKINRTTIYRLLERLTNIGLIEKILDHKSTKFKASHPEKLTMILAQKETELSQLKELLPPLITNLSAIKKSIPGPTKVIYFQGKSGLQQLLWNTLAAQAEVVGYGYLTWNSSVDRKFAEKLRREYVERKIYSKEIRNNYPKDFSEITPYLKKFYQSRFISKEKLNIKHDTYIYNRVFAFHYFYQGDFFGVEIHNPEIAKTQKQIFHLLWKLAKKTKPSF